MASRRSLGGILLLAPLLAACGALGQGWNAWTSDRSPAPLVEATVASDARLDSTGAIHGSFVGEGTSRQVTLVTSDTTIIAALARRYRPERDRRGDLWSWLAARGRLSVNIDPVDDSALVAQPVMVGSPQGHTQVRLRALTLRGSRCGWRGTRAELVVEPARTGDQPSLRGPVAGSFLDEASFLVVRRLEHREPVEGPAPALTDSLLEWTARAMDSLLAGELAPRDLPLARAAGAGLSLNGLEDDDAADVLSFRLDDGRVRHAVSLRERRRTARGTEVLAATVMIWDAAGAWQQVVFRPTLLEYRRHRMVRAYGGLTAPLFWRRLEPVSGFAFGRDYLWMEQVNVEDGSVLWVILEPRGNTIVAAAEMEGPCRD